MQKITLEQYETAKKECAKCGCAGGRGAWQCPGCGNLRKIAAYVREA